MVVVSAFGRASSVRLEPDTTEEEYSANVKSNRYSGEPGVNRTFAVISAGSAPRPTRASRTPRSRLAVSGTVPSAVAATALTRRRCSVVTGFE